MRNIDLLSFFVVAVYSTPVLAATNQELWSQLPPPAEPVDTVDTDTLASAQSHWVGAGLMPNFDIRDDGVTDAASAGLLLSGAYHLHREATASAYEVRLDTVSLGLNYLSDNATGSRVDTVTTQLASDTLEGEWRQYLLDDALWGLPLFVAGTAGFYGVNVTKVSKVDTTYQFPVSVAVSVGVGRLLPIAPRLAVARIEAMLQQDRVLRGPVPEETASRIINIFRTYRNEIGHDQRAMYTMQVLQDAGVLDQPLTPASAYRLERLLEEFVNGTLTDRRSGSDTRLSFRVTNLLASTGQPTTLAVELRDRRVFNLALDTELWFEPALGFAPRDSDQITNTLPGHRRIGLLSAAVPSIAGTLPAAAIPNGMLVADVPVNYSQLFYDTYYNPSGLLALHLGLSVGYTPSTPTTTGFALTAGGAYTIFSSGTTGYKLGALVGVAHFNDQLQSSFQLIASIVGGSGEDVYVAPDTVGDVVPFDATWLPRN